MAVLVRAWKLKVEKQRAKFTVKVRGFAPSVLWAFLATVRASLCRFAAM